MKNKNLFYFVIIIFVVIGLLVWNRLDDKERINSFFADTGVECLPGGHQSVELHVHLNLSITVDGEKEIIPKDIGIIRNCMAEIHTHDESGYIHVETVNSSRIDSLSLADFFKVWDKEVHREGYILEIIQDGEIKDSIDSLRLIDGSEIELKYSS